MRKRAISSLAVLILCLAVSPASLPATAAPGGTSPYTLTWLTVDGGGGLSSGSTYDLYMTLGQPDAWSVSCGAYRISGGFWNPAVGENVCLRYLPSIQR